MAKKILLLLIFASPYLANSQKMDPPRPGINPFRDDQNARMVYNKPDDLNAEGTPYLFDEYIAAEVTLMQGGVFPGIRVKLNVVENELLFMTESGKEMATATPVKSIKFSRIKEDESGMEDVIIESNGVALNSPGSPVYQLLVDGNARLLKRLHFSYSDVKKYPEGTMARIFKKKTDYYAAIKNQPAVKFDNSKSSLLAVFPDKRNEISSFIEKEKLKCKTEQDLVTVFSYYVSLK